MNKISIAIATTACLGITFPALAQSSPSGQEGTAATGASGASSGTSGNVSGQKVEEPTAPQEKQDLRENPTEVPPSQRLDPDSPTSPSVNGSAPH